MGFAAVDVKPTLDRVRSARRSTGLSSYTLGLVHPRVGLVQQQMGFAIRRMGSLIQSLELIE